MNINKFLPLLEQHPVLTTIIIFVLGIMGFLIKYFFFNEEKNPAPLIKAGGPISAGGDITVGNKTIHNTINTGNETNRNLKTFENYIERHGWRRETIKQREVWICEYDNLYQIEIGEKGDDFMEAWTKVYPDSNGSWRTCVYLIIGGNRIKELDFIRMDGGRIFVPLPKIHSVGNGNKFYWERNSLEFKVGKIIGRFYIHDSLEGIAEQSEIEIKN